MEVFRWCWAVGVVICLGRGADLHMAQLMPLPLTVSCSSKSRLVLPFWYRLTRVVRLNGCRCIVGCRSSPVSDVSNERRDGEAVVHRPVELLHHTLPAGGTA